MATHCIPVQELYADDFTSFIKAWQTLLMELVSTITGHASAAPVETAEEGEEILTSIAYDSGFELNESQ